MSEISVPSFPGIWDEVSKNTVEILYNSCSVWSLNSSLAEWGKAHAPLLFIDSHRIYRCLIDVWTEVGLFSKV